MPSHPQVIPSSPAPSNNAPAGASSPLKARDSPPAKIEEEPRPVIRQHNDILQVKYLVDI